MVYDRVNRRLRLNAYGQIMLEHARRSIAEMQSAGERIAALREPRHRPGPAGLSALAGELVCARTTSTVPRCRARESVSTCSRARRTRSPNACSAVRPTSRSPSPRPDGPGFAWHQLYVERLCLAVPRGHRLAAPSPDAAVRRGGGAVRRAGRAVRTAPAHRRPVRRGGHRPRTSCSRPPRSRRWRGWSPPDSASPSCRSRATARRRQGRPRPARPTPAPSAKWGWCGTAIGRCPRRRERFVAFLDDVVAHSAR